MIEEARKYGPLLKAKKYRLSFNGYPEVLVDECDLPERSFETITHGGGGQDLDVKEPGAEEISQINLVVNMPSRHSEEALYFSEWQDQVREGVPEDYERNGTCTLLGPKNQPALRWEIKAAWCKSAKPTKLDSKDKSKQWQLNVVIEVYNVVPKAG